MSATVQSISNEITSIFIVFLFGSSVGLGKTTKCEGESHFEEEIGIKVGAQINGTQEDPVGFRRRKDEKVQEANY